ncbi:Mu transposase C-terminal domain-containing protein [Malaciobacter mytili]|uniref:Mu transposase C-terminal domain-containing protein n=1 Tax=Malaciobacter mytili TaxID=603050 RepID=UPI003BAE6BF5
MSLKINEDSIVYKLDQQYVITKLIDYNYVFAKNTDTGEIVKLHHTELSSKPIQEQKLTIDDYSMIPKDKIEDAKARLEAIKPLLNINSRREVERRAKEIGVSPNTLYNWLRRYEATEQLSSLAFMAPRGGKGKSRLIKEQEEIIDLAIKEHYLTKQRLSVQRVYEIIYSNCENAKVKPPSIASVRRRVKKISEAKLTRRREGKKAAEKHEIILGKYPDGLYPLHVIQIDHTQADVRIVDDEQRVVLDRPWITVAIDIYSRMVAGFYVSLETPGFFGIGQTLINTILPKNELLEKYNLKSQYPICGKFKILHSDQGSDFKSIDLKEICEEYGIDTVFRAPGKARQGGHIERLLGSLSKYIHILYGSTFEKIDRNRDYDSAKEASMTLEEFEEWISILIVDTYHNKKHSQLGMTPLQKFEEGVFGTATQPAKGFAPRIENIDELKINFLPKEKRTVQRDGIQIDNITYYSEVLNSWIDSYEEIRGKKIKKKFTIRRDRDISYIWFYDERVKTYYKIPYRNPSLPKISIWEYKAAVKHLKQNENRIYNESEVFAALERMRHLAENSKNKTKQQRKLIDRANKRKKQTKEIKLLQDKVQEIGKESQKSLNENTNNFDWFNEEIIPFSGIEEYSINQKEESTKNINKNIVQNFDNELPF